ncbi:ecto-NOX disulfide-thiol exchanger 2-like [Lytechinus variegatus]|uniref:ecto-NOX disulfide-thiol exchanger 2-like n=1 Tax=Lytechinus variegatus TaxID=7654 RepID=UPI001BB27F19|nr:ecto-NOX disulfide-thiol exchanger 2-like [Lytechinus variegatus]
MDLGRRNPDLYGRDGSDPSSNNMPLQFSSRSGPKIIENSRDEEQDIQSSDRGGRRSRRRKSTPDRQMWEEGGAMGYQDNLMNSALMMGGSGGSPVMPGPDFGGLAAGYPFPLEGQDYMQGGPMGGQPMMPMGGSLMGPPMGGPMGMGDLSGNGPRKPVLHFADFTLFPPTVHQGPPPVGERPLGCKTIFVGGQPENMTVDMLLELFTKHGGEVINIRQGKRNFCHVRFKEEMSIDKAMFVSGYRVRIGANIDPPNNGRLRLDFAENRDDQYEFECDQRRRAREARHASKTNIVVPEEPAVTPRYSHIESSNLLAKVKDGETFPQAANMLITWLERGECDKRNSTQFYNLVKSAHMHVRRLIGEKAQCDLNLNQIQQQFRMQVIGLITQYTLIEQVLMSACKQKVWDHFTKAQRKNIEGWKQQTKELRQQQQEELGLGEKGEAEMDMSDEEDQSGTHNEAKRQRTDTPTSDSSSKNQSIPPAQTDDQLQLQVQALMHQNNVLRNQLESQKSKDESTILAPPGTTPTTVPIANEEMEMQIKALQHSLLSMQQQLQDTKNKWKKEESMRKETEDRLQSVEAQLSSRSDPVPTKADTDLTLDPKKADMIALLSIFLHVHPFGASTEYLWSYMQRINPSVTIPEIEALLNSYPTIFRQDLFGVGASLEKRWRYTAFSKFYDLKLDNNSS